MLRDLKCSEPNPPIFTPSCSCDHRRRRKRTGRDAAPPARAGSFSAPFGTLADITRTPALAGGGPAFAGASFADAAVLGQRCPSDRRCEPWRAEGERYRHRAEPDAARGDVEPEVAAQIVVHPATRPGSERHAEG